MNILEMKRKKMPEAWFTFDTRSGALIKLAYLPLPEYRKTMELCTELVNGREKVSDEKVLEETARLILDWDLTLGKVAELIPIDVPEGRENDAVPCTMENKKAIISNAWSFKDFINIQVTRLGDFIAAEREERRKNFGSSPTGGSAADSTAKIAAS